MAAPEGLSQINALIKPGDIPPREGLYLRDVGAGGAVRYGFPNISDNAEIVEMMASGTLLAEVGDVVERGINGMGIQHQKVVVNQ